MSNVRVTVLSLAGVAAYGILVQMGYKLTEDPWVFGLTFFFTGSVVATIMDKLNGSSKKKSKPSSGMPTPL